MKPRLCRMFVCVLFVCGFLTCLVIPAGLIHAQEDTVQSRALVPDQKPGTVYLLNEASREVRFALSYDARKWEDYALNPRRSCTIPVEEFGHTEVIVRYVEKMGSEKSLKLEMNERYKFVYNASLKEWGVERLR
ncbi:MAG: hypothetical protein IH600_04005 [Bacteroidetes bacterium]|nr:hypothetical protein [Bacteroidota bacterium]